ncbi:AAA family ATPase [Janthinobacterium fluminis]|uniref:AAA family ATPase n=1 Tax=Janthinobacterium fluminis TaxID=2987524 RepID=A0ABT5JZZ8_9BURK|nr:AAA family ATPase [Janthinobacterium fluminis]MDC8758025.1 AAA family ATPase [Janthinobacterium fluminis]
MKIAVISKDASALADMAALLRQRKPSDTVAAVAGTLAQLPGGTPPDVLVLDQPDVAEAELAQLERLGNGQPQLAVILLCRNHTPQLLLQAMRAGVREVLASPAPPASLAAAVERVEHKREQRQPAGGQVLAFISCKGGSGATFLATNLGYALAASGSKRVALIDLNLQFGDASLFVSEHKPLATLADVAQQIHRLDPSFLASSMLSITPNYGVLAAPEDPAHANDVLPEHVDAILHLARRHYDFVILDIGRSLDAISIRALDQADTIYPILQTTLPYIRDGRRLLDAFRALGYPKKKIQLVVNRHDKGSDIRLQDLEGAYGSAIFKAIPNHYEAAAASVNQGVPILKLDPGSPLTRALQDFAQGLTGEAAPAGQGWMARLFQRAA